MKKFLLATCAVLAITASQPSFAGGKGGNQGGGTGVGISNNRNVNKNTNVNTNININRNSATAIANVKINLPGGGSGGGAGATGGIPSTTITSGFTSFSGAAPSGGGGSCCNSNDVGGGWGWVPNSLSLGQYWPRALKSKEDKWDVDLVCTDEIGELMSVKLAAGADDMSVTVTDDSGITWDRFEMYSSIDKEHPFKIGKVGDNQWFWHGYRNGMAGVTMTGTLSRTDKGFKYIELQDIGGGTRLFTNATCHDRAFR